MKSTKNKQLVKKDNRQIGESVRKHVAAIHTSGELSLLARKMANVLLLNAYDDLLIKRTHTIPIKLLTHMLGWDESNNVENLKSALEQLASTAVTFDLMGDGKGSWAVVSMLAFGEIKNGICSYRYDEYLAERLYDPEVYATINIKIQRKLQRGYSLSLYENCLRYKNVGSTGWWEIGKFRRLLGVEGVYYDPFKVLNGKIIKPSVEEINKSDSSEIYIEPEFQREQRKITSIRFLVKEHPQQTIVNNEKVDEYVEIRENSTYKHLREHGIGDKLAIAWVLQDEKRASEVIAYVEEKDKKKKIKRSTGAYIKKLIEEGAEVGKSLYKTKKEEEEKTIQDQKQSEEQEKAAKNQEIKKKIAEMFERFDPLPEAKKTALRKAFAKTLSDVLRGNFEKNTEKSPMHRYKFCLFLETQDF